MGLRSGSVDLAFCAMLIGTASAWALAPHDKAVGPGVVRAAALSSDDAVKQPQAPAEHGGATKSTDSETGKTAASDDVKVRAKDDEPASSQNSSSGDGKGLIDEATLAIAFLTLCALVVQTVIFGMQAKRLKETIDAMKDVGAGQSKDMQESLRIAAEASRANQAASDTAAKQLARDSEALIARERAYYAFSSFGIHFAHFEGKMVQWVFEVIWKNYGNRPPRNVISCTSMEFFDEPVDDDYLFPDKPVNPNDPFGKGIFAAPQATVRGVMIPVTVADLQLIAKGRKYLSIWGWVEYDDGFIGTPRRRSEFAADVQIVGIVTQPNPSHANVRMHKRHNGTDDECMKPATT